MMDATICLIFNNGKVLLQKKASGKFGEGKWNGPGGKIEMNETPEQAAIREVKEETNLNVKGLDHAGILNFREEGGKRFAVHVFTTGKFSGKIKDGSEGEHNWFPTDSMPYDEMWEDDRVWFPYVLRKEKFIGDFMHSKGFKTLVSSSIEKL